MKKAIGGVESSAHTDSGTTGQGVGHLVIWLSKPASRSSGGDGRRAGADPVEFLRRGLAGSRPPRRNERGINVVGFEGL